jgi:hypothetical protein
MVRRNVRSLRPLILSVICGAGLLGGIAVGTSVVLSTGILHWAPVLGTALDSIIAPAVSIVIVSSLGWLGAKIGLAIIARMQP